MTFHPKRTVMLLTLALAAAGAQAATEYETLNAMKQTNIAVDWQPVPQTGAKADQVKQNLTKVKLPPGFHISLYALVPDARHIAVGPQGIVNFVGTRKSSVWAVTSRPS